MLKKIIIIFGLLLLLTGCNELEMNDEIIVEETKINEDFESSMEAALKGALAVNQATIEEQDGNIVFKCTKNNLKKIETVEEATATLKAVQNELGIKDFSYKTKVQIIDSEEYNCFLCRQLYKGVQVKDGSFKLFITKDGKFSHIVGQYKDITLDSIEPAISIEEAQEISGYEKVIVRGLFIDNNKLYWRIKTNSGSYVDIDATTGEIVNSGGSFVADK